jgi:hypothetical protein
VFTLINLGYSHCSVWGVHAVDAHVECQNRSKTQIDATPLCKDEEYTMKVANTKNVQYLLRGGFSCEFNP